MSELEELAKGFANAFHGKRRAIAEGSARAEKVGRDIGFLEKPEGETCFSAACATADEDCEVFVGCERFDAECVEMVAFVVTSSEGSLCELCVGVVSRCEDRFC